MQVFCGKIIHGGFFQHAMFEEGKASSNQDLQRWNPMKSRFRVVKPLKSPWKLVKKSHQIPFKNGSTTGPSPKKIIFFPCRGHCSLGQFLLRCQGQGAAAVSNGSPNGWLDPMKIRWFMRGIHPHGSDTSRYGNMEIWKYYISWLSSDLALKDSLLFEYLRFARWRWRICTLSPSIGIPHMKETKE